MTWQNGRQLATLQQGDNNISYSYGSDSVRVSKNVNGTEYTYAYLNGMLMYETRGESKFYYSYDANGIIYSVKYTLTDSSDLMTYYYTHNSRGDIVGIYNGNGDLKAHYEYDAWGNVLSITDASGNAVTSDTHIGTMNPFRYRGYYLDTETGLYYLMSRYYDPVTHRFINADGYFQSGGDILDANMSAYCGNNPIIRTDQSGEFWQIAVLSVALVSVAILSGCSNNASKSNKKQPSNYKNSTTTNHNCYSYAFNLPYTANPGDFSATAYNYSDRMYSDKNIYTTGEITNYVMRDMQSLNKSVRIIDYPSDKKNNEYVVAMKTSTEIISDIGIADYHFAVQLSDGTWADKPGGYPSRWNEIDGTASSWDCGDIKDYYNTESVYFAVEK